MAHNNNYKWARKSWRKQRHAGRALASLRKSSTPTTCTTMNRKKKMKSTLPTMILPRTMKKDQGLSQKKRNRPLPHQSSLKISPFAICSFEREEAPRWTTSSTARSKNKKTPSGHSKANNISATSTTAITTRKTTLRAALAAINSTAILTKLNQTTKAGNRDSKESSAKSMNSTRRKKGAGRI